VKKNLKEILENKPLHEIHKLNCDTQISSMIESIKTLLGNDEEAFKHLVDRVRQDEDS